MLGSNKSNNNKVYFLKITTKDKDKKNVAPHFAVSEKVGDKWEVTKEVKDVSGNLTGVTIEKKTWEDQEYDVIKLALEDTETQETYVLDLRQNLLSRSIFNSFLNLKTFDNIEVGLYTKKGEGAYPAVSVKQNGERVSWAFELDKLPKIEKVKVGKKEVVDSTQLDEFYLERLKELAVKVKSGANQTSTSEASPKPKAKAKKPAPIDINTDVEPELAATGGDDIPF